MASPFSISAWLSIASYASSIVCHEQTNKREVVVVKACLRTIIASPLSISAWLPCAASFMFFRPMPVKAGNGASDDSVARAAPLAGRLAAPEPPAPLAVGRVLACGKWFS